MESLPERQHLAVSLRYGGAGPLMPYRQIAAFMGNGPQRAHRLVRKGVARLRANGHDPADLREPANY
jgi:DNA-directed RNA polymerase specialized sigma subunit